jgi:hypothetical protein
MKTKETWNDLMDQANEATLSVIRKFETWRKFNAWSTIRRATRTRETSDEFEDDIWKAIGTGCLKMLSK